MEAAQAVEILKTLSAVASAGDDENSVTVAPQPSRDVAGALQMAIESLEAGVRSPRRGTNLPRNAGRMWSQEEDQRLLAAFDGGATVGTLAAAHERTQAGIEARLIKHGRLDETQASAGQRMRIDALQRPADGRSGQDT